MKKIFTLFALLVAAVTGAQAESYIPTTVKTLTETQTIIINDIATEAKKDGWMVIPQESYNDKVVVADPDQEIETPSGNVKCLQVKADGNLYNSKKRVCHMLVTGISGVKAIGQSNNGRGFRIGATEYTDAVTEKSTMTIVAGEGEALNPVSYDGLDPEKTYIISVLADGGDTFLYAVRFTVPFTLPSSDTPAIIASSVTIFAGQSGVAATEEISVKGANLTGSNLSATISPAVEGLSVELASTAITDGAVETTATVSYVSTVNVEESTTTLTITDGTTSREVHITYSAFVVDYEQEPVSEASTWDFTNGITSGNVQYGSSDRYERLYANMKELTFADSFNAKALTFDGEWARRDNKYAQNGTLRFETTVPGTVTVTFSNTGGSNSNRFVQVNDILGEVEAVGTAQRDETFNVVAGPVEITGVALTEGDSNSLRYFKVVFTPVTTVPVNITSAGAASFSSIYPVSLADSGLKAYIVTAKNGSVFARQEVEGVIPANTGVILEGAEGSYELTIADGDSGQGIDGNLLVATSTGAYTTTPNDYGFVYGFFQSAVSGKIGFQKKKIGWTCAANKCYLRLDEYQPANEIFFDTVDAINTVNADVNVVKGQTYNLSGQKVNADYRGIIIRDGHKMIQR